MAPTPWDLETTAVVCVECQNGVLGTESVLPALAADSSELVSSVRRLLDSARQVGVRVVHATYEGNLGGQPTGTARIWRALGPATADWAPGSASTAVLPELLVFVCTRCGQTVIREQPELRDDPSLRKPSTPS